MTDKGTTTDSGTRIDRRALAQLVAANTQGFTEQQVYQLIGTLTETIVEQLARGNSVAITGFGTWRPTERQARKGINPQTRQQMDIPARRTASFGWGTGASSKLAGSTTGAGTGGGVGGQGRGGRGKT